MAETKKPKWWVVDEITIYDNPEEAKAMVDEEVIENATNGWETAGTTVPQNTQNATNSESGTSVSNGNWTIKVWEQNANLNYYQYWDDSNPAQQWQKGWMNPKYTWEWVSNSYIEYNPDLTVADLDPNYLYWENARQQNRQEAWYIARRNDQIASALYNEWLTSREDVANFLSQQKEWMNSTEADRENTIESIYKRLGQMKPQEEKPDLSKADNLVTDTSGKIYGKTTAEEWNPRSWIETKVDANSVLNSMEQRRSSELKNFVSTDIQTIASCVVNWMTYWDEQTWRDAQEIYPDFIAAVNAEVKKQRGQENITSISMWWWLNVTSQLSNSENNVSNSLNTFVSKTAKGSWAWTLSTNLNNALAESEIVSGAREQMEVYKRKIVEIQQAADELPSIAQQAFKWDVPQYVVNAFVNNRLQQYNKEIEKYQNLYNASLDEAKLEISQTQWREEMNYKRANLQADMNYKNANLELSKKELELNMKKAWVTNWQWNDDGSYSYVDMEGNMHTLSAQEAQKAINQELYNKSTAFIDYWKKAIDDAKANWETVNWWQCEAMTDNYARQNFWTEMKREDWSAWATTVDEKARYATEALPQRWYVAVFDFWKKDADWVNRWHTWIVIDYDPVTWDFTTLESNVDWHWKVEIKTRNINNEHLIWFRDPTQWEPWNWNWKWKAQYDYYNFPNWMLDLFIEWEKVAKETWWVEAVKDIKRWRRAYWILNEMANNNELESIMYDDEIAKAYEDITKYLLQNAYIRNLVDDKSNFVLDTVIQDMMNTWKFWVSPDNRAALDHIIALVQIKLRRDSWAAINVSEWEQDFGMYMPQIWMSPQTKLKRMRDLENAAVADMLPWAIIKDYKEIITDEMIKNADPKVREEKMNEATAEKWIANWKK